MADRSVRVRLEAITANFNRKISESAVLTRRFSHELESADSRMANIVQTGLALAPALVPLGAAGIPAIAGLTTQLGFAALATGTLVLGLNGVGDALKALDTYQLDPTADHFKKLQQTLEKLGPAGGEFVLFLDQVEPRLKQLRNLAEQGLLPGAEEGITHLLNLLPQVRDIIFTTSTTLGDLLRDAGDNLDDPRWQKFFGFLETRARPTLTEMGQTAGNFAEAFTNLVMAFDPLERDFSQGLLHMSQHVRDWSDGLEHTDGFQHLVDYVQKNGPRALDTLGAFADALIQIVEAGAPVGSVLLPAVTEVLHVVAAIADTPAGPVIIGVAAAVGTLGRSLALLKAVGLRGEGDSFIGRALGVKEIQGVPATYRKVAAATDELRVAQEAAAAAAVRARDAQFALIPTAQQRSAITEYATAQDRVRQAEERLTTAQQRRADALKQTAVTAGKTTALIAGIAVAETGLADKAGLANTASLALMGTFIAPGWGTALGGAAGFVIDLTHANDDLKDSIRQVDRAAESVDFSTMRAGIADMQRQLHELDNAGVLGSFKELSGGNLVSKAQAIPVLGSWISIFGDTKSASDRTRSAIGDAEDKLKTLRKNAVDLFATLNGANPKGLKLTDDELTTFITKISPALQRAGVDVNKLLQNRSGWLDAQLAVHDWVTEMDSAQGRSKAVGAALAGLQDEITPTVDAAKALSDALDALFGPEMNQAEALNQWMSGLHDLRDELGKTGKAILGNSDAALKNQALLIDAVKKLQDRVKSDAAAGVSGDKIVQTLLKGRDAIIAQAVAAGKSRPEVEKYLNTLGLTPDNLVTVVSTPGLLTAKQQVEALGKLYRLTPKEVRTLISQLNMDHSQAAIAKLSKQYNLTPKQVQTLVRLLGVDPALAQVHELSAAMAALRDKTVTIKLRNIYEATHTSDALGGIHHYAQGDIANRHMPELAGPGPTRMWREPETQGEAYIPLANDFRRPRAVDIWEKTGIALGVQFQKFAMGGFNGSSAGAGIDYAQLAAAVNGNQLLAQRATRDALLSAMRTALREMPVQRVSRDLTYGQAY